MKYLPGSLGLSAGIAVVPPYTATSRLEATQVAMVLESSAVEYLTLQPVLLLSTPPEETGVRELECLHCADSKSDFSEALSTIVIVHSVKYTASNGLHPRKSAGLMQ